MTPYKRAIQTKITPQSLPIPGEEERMVPNATGGYGYLIMDEEWLTRFLILGSEGGTYYATEQKLTTDAVKKLGPVLKSLGLRAVEILVDISINGRAPRLSPTLFALAVMFASSEHAVAVDRAFRRIVRTHSHLLEFVSYVTELRGTGRRFRRVVGDWYTSQNAPKLSYQLLKYRNRHGFTTRDVLRLAHPKPKGSDQSGVFAWATKDDYGNVPLLIKAYEELQNTSDPVEAVQLLTEYPQLTHEMLPAHLQTNRNVWAAMLPNMPMTAMIRSLGRMQAYEALGKEQVDIIGKKLNEENLKAARVHPMSVLLALATYRSGNGQRGSLFWKPNAKIVEALDTAFYLSFASVEPTGVPTLIGLDVSASMGAPVLNSVLSCREAAVAMAMITLKTEPFVDVYGFTTSFIDLRTMIKAGSSLQDNVNRVSSLPFGGTDCSLPMKWARQNRNMYGAFAIYTDNETWAGQSHASQELREYRRVMGSTARLAVQAFALNDVSIGDPDDPYTLGLAGLDASAPAIMSAFFRGEL